MHYHFPQDGTACLHPHHVHAVSRSCPRCLSFPHVLFPFGPFRHIGVVVALHSKHTRCSSAMIASLLPRGAHTCLKCAFSFNRPPFKDSVPWLRRWGTSNPFTPFTPFIHLPTFFVLSCSCSFRLFPPLSVVPFSYFPSSLSTSCTKEGEKNIAQHPSCHGPYHVSHDSFGWFMSISQPVMSFVSVRLLLLAMLIHHDGCRPYSCVFIHLSAETSTDTFTLVKHSMGKRTTQVCCKLMR